MKQNLRQKFKTEIIKDLMNNYGYKNSLQVPKLEKVVVNIGLGEAMSNSKLLDAGINDLTAITGQKPLITRAKKSIATFKIRKGGPVGCMVTLRGQRMYDFFSKLVNFVLPRLRDFKGVSLRSFDGRGNYNLGLKEQLVFPEISYDKVDNARGMDIAFVTTAKSNEEAKALLAALGMPFRKTEDPKEFELKKTIKKEFEKGQKGEKGEKVKKKEEAKEKK